MSSRHAGTPACDLAAADAPLTRRDRRKEDRRAAIVAVGLTAFLRDGYGGTTMSAIAAELGGSKATLWSYFPSKEALFSAVLDSYINVHRSELMTVLNPGGDVRETLRQFCRRFMALILTDHALALHRVINGESGRFPELSRMFYERAPAVLNDVLAQYLGDHIAQGHLRDDDPLFIARTLTALLFGWLHRQTLWGVVEPTPAQINREADDAIEIVMRAFGPLDAVPAGPPAGNS